MKKLTGSSTAYGQIDGYISEIERLKELELLWIHKGKPKSLVNYDPKKGDLFWGERVWDQITQLQTQLDALRQLRKNQVPSLSSLKRKYRGKSILTITHISEKRFTYLWAEIAKWEQEIREWEQHFAQDILEQRIPNYALAHVANVGLALEQDNAFIAQTEFRMIIMYRVTHKAWYTRLFNFLRSLLLPASHTKQRNPS